MRGPDEPRGMRPFAGVIDEEKFYYEGASAREMRRERSVTKVKRKRDSEVKAAKRKVAKAARRKNR